MAVEFSLWHTRLAPVWKNLQKFQNVAFGPREVFPLFLRCAVNWIKVDRNFIIERGLKKERRIFFPSRTFFPLENGPKTTTRKKNRPRSGWRYNPLLVLSNFYVLLGRRVPLSQFVHARMRDGVPPNSPRQEVRLEIVSGRRARTFLWMPSIILIFSFDSLELLNML